MKNRLGKFIALCLALAASSAQAVYLSADGLGQALIYPYYTARSTVGSNAYVTALTVVNTTAFAKAVKVRFLEGKNSKEVLDFTLFLSAYDMWTAGVVAAGDGAGIFTRDNSCIVPALSRSAEFPQKFRSSAYVGDGGGDLLDRTYEGYFEVLEMGTIQHGSALEAAVTHVRNVASPNASKPSCTGLPITDALPAGLVAPTGGLMGSASLINVNEGTDYSYDAVALDNWSNQTRWARVGDSSPVITDASPAISVVTTPTPSGGQVIVTNWGAGNGRNAVSAVLMRSNVYGEYTVESGIKAAMDWVVTMPTKTWYVNSGSARPFQSTFGVSGSCDAVGLTYLDREEQTPGALVDFSPTTPQTRSLCNEVNVLTFTANGGTAAVSNVLRSKNVANVALNAGWVNGWADLSFPFNAVTGAHSLPAPVGATTVTNLATGAVSANQSITYYGLPVVGFAVQSFANGAIPSGGTTVLSNYGGSFIHKYSRDIR